MRGERNPAVQPATGAAVPVRDEGAWAEGARVPVVVLDAAPYSGLGIARSLGRLGVAVHGVHPAARTAAARSRYWATHHVWDFAAAPPQASVTWLLRLGRNLGGRPLLVPTSDAGSLFVAEHAPALAEAFRFPRPPPGLTHALASKGELYRLCRAHGIPTAETAFPRSHEDVERFARAARFPVMLKGIDTLALHARVGQRMQRVDDAQALLALYDAWATPGAPNLVVQEYLPGDCDQVWIFTGYFDAQARCLFGLTGQKLREYPPGRGVTSLGVCRHNPEVHALGVRFMAAVGYQGILDLDFKWDPRAGTYKALDANPRVGANFRIFVDRTGQDVVQALYRDLTGQPVPAPLPREGRKWLVEDFDCVSSTRYLRAGRIGPFGWLRSLRGVQETAWFAPDDPLPALARGRQGVGALLARARPRPR